MTKKKKRDPNTYPAGLSASKVRKLVDHYDRQTDEDAAAEIERAPVAFVPTAWLEVPVELVPRIKKLISQHRKSA